MQFLSTLSLRRATKSNKLARQKLVFLSTLSLRRATARRESRQQPAGISIHALLAESDKRLKTPCVKLSIISIHALLAESDLQLFLYYQDNMNFYPRSPCGERLMDTLILTNAVLFLSTLSLRRATGHPSSGNSIDTYFYPRSPCGERHLSNHQSVNYTLISIHALLAESDYLINTYHRIFGISIHALLAESDFQPNNFNQ